MALDDATSAAPGRTPSLLAGRSDAGARDSQSSRILASLEGRAPQAERQHMPPARKRSSRGWWLLLLLLLLVGTGGGAAWWRTQQKGNATAMPAGSIMANGTGTANGNGGGQAGAANGATEATGVSGASGASRGAAGNVAGSTGSTAAPAESATGAAGSSSGASSSASASGASAAYGQGNANKSAGETASPATASIVDAPGSNREASALAIADARRAEEDKPPSNPLSALTATTAAIPPQQVALADKGKATDGKSVDGKGAPAKGDGKSSARNNHNTKAKKKADSDAALLSALMSYGLPPPTSATAAALPGTPLAERLQQCRRKPFLESEQCRLQVCAGQWGLAPECPNPQAQTQMPKRP